MPEVDVAVVIPAFRAESYLDAALASLAAQSARPSEVVVVDDASDDATFEAARRWEAMLPIQVIRSARNTGPAAARHRGIESASASRIALLDADDAFLPDHLTTLSALAPRPGFLASADGLRWRPGRGVQVRSHGQNVVVPRASEQPSAILFANFVFVGSLFWRVDYDATGGFRDGFSGAEDWHLWIRLIRCGVVVVPSPVASYLYRVTEESLTGRPDIRHVYVRVLEDIMESTGDDQVVDALAWHRARAALGDSHAAIRTGNGPAARTALAGAPTVRGRLRLQLAVARRAPRCEMWFADRMRQRRW